MAGTFEQRIDWIIEHRPEFHGSVSDLSIAAGLQRTSLSKIIDRSRQRGGVPGMRSLNLLRLASAARVDVRWLERGEGVPELTLAGAASTDAHAIRLEAAELLEQGHGLTPEQAWFLMRDVAPETLSVKAFYLAGVQLMRERATTEAPSTPERKVEVPAAKADAMVARMRRSTKR